MPWTGRFSRRKDVLTITNILVRWLTELVAALRASLGIRYERFDWPSSWIHMTSSSPMTTHSFWNLTLLAKGLSVISLEAKLSFKLALLSYKLYVIWMRSGLVHVGWEYEGGSLDCCDELICRCRFTRHVQEAGSSCRQPASSWLILIMHQCINCWTTHISHIKQ